MNQYRINQAIENAMREAGEDFEIQNSPDECVRCKDCMYGHRTIRLKDLTPGDIECCHPYLEDCFLLVPDDGFCRFGKEKNKMSGLEMLRELIQKYWPLPEWRNKSEFANELREIANEIERDMQDSINQLMHYADTIHKPFAFGESVGEWLDRWYFPRPVIDGEPVQFGDELMIELLPIELKERHTFEAKSIQFCNDGNAYIDGFEEERCERVQPDSIEKLRIEMCNFNGCGSGAYIEFEACRECNVTEWLRRAEKLFKDGENDD